MARGRLPAPSSLLNPEDEAMADNLIEWLDHPTVAKDKVGKRSRMGDSQATKQISSGRARAVDESEPAKPKQRSKQLGETQVKEETEAED